MSHNDFLDNEIQRFKGIHQSLAFFGEHIIAIFELEEDIKNILIVNVLCRDDRI